LCQDAVLVGTAGPKGLEQHKGKKKCLANIEKRKKVEKEAKTLTLFSFLQLQDKETASTATETLRMEEKQKAAIASLILVSGSTHPPLDEEVAETDTAVPPAREGSDDEHTRTMQETAGGREREKRKGCQHAWLLLGQLQAAIRTIPHRTPEGRASDELAKFNRCTASTVCATVTQDELWKCVNPALDRMLGFGRSNKEIQEIIRRGAFGESECRVCASILNSLLKKVELLEDYSKEKSLP
jgi:hypothetical protein